MTVTPSPQKSQSVAQAANTDASALTLPVVAFDAGDTLTVQFRTNAEDPREFAAARHLIKRGLIDSLSKALNHDAFPKQLRGGAPALPEMTVARVTVTPEAIQHITVDGAYLSDDGFERVESWPVPTEVR